MTIDIHHRFDPIKQALHFGDGRDLFSRPDDAVLDVTDLSEGTAVGDVVQMADGGIYFVDFIEQVVKHVATDGTVTRAIGTGINAVFEDGTFDETVPDGVPAIEASFFTINSLDLAPDGSLLVLAGDAIWRLERDQTLRRLVGGGTLDLHSIADGVSATAISFQQSLVAFDVGRDGAIYLGFQGRQDSLGVLNLIQGCRSLGTGTTATAGVWTGLPSNLRIVPSLRSTKASSPQADSQLKQIVGTQR